jgi:hypothetical protein
MRKQHRQVRLVPLIAALLLCAPTWADSKGACNALLLVSEVQNAPEADAIVISLIANEDVDFQVFYGTSSSDLSSSTSVVNGSAGVRADVAITGLEADETYAYQVRCKGPGDASWYRRGTHTFNTKKSVGQSFQFAHVGDTHSAYGSVVRSGYDADWYILQQTTIANILSRDNDFVLFTGDEPLTGTSIGQVYPWIDGGWADGVSSTLAEAKQRYMWWLSTFRELTAELPLFFVHGNHDTHLDLFGSCATYPENSSTLWRQAYNLILKNPADTYAGETYGRYYSFDWGSMRFVMLDSLSFQSGEPIVVTDPTLGATQLAFLTSQLTTNTLQYGSIWLHSMVGGLVGPGACPTFYQRNSLRATTDGFLGGDFLGEMKDIHELLVATGSEVCGLGHDHFAHCAEKLNANYTPSGVHYMQAGDPSSIIDAGVWLINEDYRAYGDWDNDGYYDWHPSNYGGVAISIYPGYMQYTVTPTSIVAEWILSDVDDDAVNNTAAFEYTIRPSN